MNLMPQWFQILFCSAVYYSFQGDYKAAHACYGLRKDIGCFIFLNFEWSYVKLQ